METGVNDDSLVVLDFETTGLSPAYGDRAIEIGAVLLRHNRIVDQFQSLMNPGMRVSSFIQDYTGISNAMLKKAPPVGEVMREFTRFMANHHLVAHNASFDRRFLDAELERIHIPRKQEFACSMLISRRLYPDAPNHRLETLVNYRSLQTNGVFHRALADAEMTAHLWADMVNTIKRVYNFSEIHFSLMQRISKISKTAVSEYLTQTAASMAPAGRGKR